MTIIVPGGYLEDIPAPDESHLRLNFFRTRVTLKFLYPFQGKTKNHFMEIIKDMIELILIHNKIVIYTCI